MRKIDLSNFRVARSDTARDINRRIMLNLVRKHQPISRADLARRSGLQRSTVSTIAELMAAVGQSPAALLNLWSTSCSAALAQLHDGVPMQSDRKLRRKLSTLYTATMDGRGTAAPSQEEASSGAARLRTQSELRSLQTAQQAADAIKARIDVIVRKSGGYL